MGATGTNYLNVKLDVSFYIPFIPFFDTSREDIEHQGTLKH
jgi:hypothetical protein